MSSGVAFTNAAGGRLVLRIEDGTRHVVGVADSLNLEEPIANRVADAALAAELARRTGAEGFDEEPLADLDSEAIDFAAASQCFAERRELGRRDVETLGMVRRYQGRTVPTGRPPLCARRW
jgi:predicted HTH transcriptional regulator